MDRETVMIKQPNALTAEINFREDGLTELCLLPNMIANSALLIGARSEDGDMVDDG